MGLNKITKSSCFCMTLSIFILLCLLVIAYWLSFHAEFYADVPTEFTRNVCPTRNMSYDLRGDIPIPRKDWPFMNATIGPRDPEACIRKPLILG